MFIVRLTTCLMLLMTLNQHGLGIRSQNVTILKQASNERLRPTHHQHYSAQTEYVKSNEKKNKIPSSKINLIFKKIKQPIYIHDKFQTSEIGNNEILKNRKKDKFEKIDKKVYNNSKEIINDVVISNIDLPVSSSSTKLLNNFVESRGKYIGKCCEVRKASVVKKTSPSFFIKNPLNNSTLSSYRSFLLKQITHQDDNLPLSEFNILKMNNVSSIENADNKETESTQVSLKTAIKDSANINHEFKEKINKRNRRQLKLIPISSLTRKTNNSPSISPMFNSNNINVTSNNSLPKFDPYFIRKILGVFDRMQPVFGDNFHSIPPGQFILAPTKYIDDAKLLPASFQFNSGRNFQHEKQQLTQQQKHQERQQQRNNDGEIKFVQNPTGLGESKRMHTTGVEKIIIDDEKIIDENPIASVEKNDDPSGFIMDSLNQSNSTIETDDKKPISTSENNRDSTGTRTEHQKYKLPEIESRAKLQQNFINNRDDLSAKYTFEYQVDDEKSNNFFGHRESRNGQLTVGNYVVRLSDSIIQSVNYRVDENGYHAAVTYSTENFNGGKMHP